MNYVCSAIVGIYETNFDFHGNSLLVFPLPLPMIKHKSSLLRRSVITSLSPTPVFVKLDLSNSWILTFIEHYYV